MADKPEEQPERWLDDSDPVEKAAQRKPAVFFPPPLSDAELRAEESAYLQANGYPDRKGGYIRQPGERYRAAFEPLFLDEDSEGEEMLSIEESGRWRAIMEWPTLPTIAEITQFKSAHHSRLVNDNWTSLVAGRDADVAAAKVKSDAAQAEIVKRFGPRSK